MVTLDWHDTLTIDPASTGSPPTDRSPAACRSTRRTSWRQALRPRRSHRRRAHPQVDPTRRRARRRFGRCRRRAALGRLRRRRRAAALGADVAFCLVGGRARVRGIGELVEPLPFEPIDITLVVPPLAVSTPVVYRAWDELGGPTADGAERSRTGSDRRRSASWRAGATGSARRAACARRWPAAERHGSYAVTTISTTRCPMRSSCAPRPAA